MLFWTDSSYFCFCSFSDCCLVHTRSSACCPGHDGKCQPWSEMFEQRLLNWKLFLWFATLITSCFELEKLPRKQFVWQISLCSSHTCFLIGWGADQSHLSSCYQDTGGVVAKHRSTTFTSWTIFLKVRIWKIVLPHRSAEAGPRNTCSFSVKYHHPRSWVRTISSFNACSQLRWWSPSNPIIGPLPRSVYQRNMFSGSECFKLSIM